MIFAYLRLTCSYTIGLLPSRLALRLAEKLTAHKYKIYKGFR
jgi:hypothetical protein